MELWWAIHAIKLHLKIHARSFSTRNYHPSPWHLTQCKKNSSPWFFFKLGNFNLKDFEVIGEKRCLKCKKRSWNISSQLYFILFVALSFGLKNKMRTHLNVSGKSLGEFSSLLKREKNYVINKIFSI